MTSTEQDTVNNCPKCKKPITDQVIKALGKIYHQDCFTCYDCGTICKLKYFPYKLPTTGELVPLCQLDYFKRNKLLCYVCSQPLRGTFFNAFGRLYDEEHFCCKICGEQCSMQECFNYKDDLYCKYHYLKYFSKRCKGCQYPITDQHFEFPRGDKIYRWHPECYGIHRYWHIDLQPDCLGLPLLLPNSYVKDVQMRDTNPTPAEMNRCINISDNLTCKTWSTLYKFEEETAGCISDMLQYLTSEDKTKGVKATALFVLKVECLFKALDSLQSINDYRVSSSTLSSYSAGKSGKNASSSEEVNGLDAPESSVDPTESIAQKYKKFPKQLSSKIMIYLQLLRKSTLQSDSNEVTVSNVMSIINGLSHYLKLLIRYGLYNALEYNKRSHSTNALVKFLRETNKNLNYPASSNPFDFILDVPIDSTDCCSSCNKYIQQDCIKYQENKRWHIQCFNCSDCGKLISKYDILDATYNKKTQKVFCPLCSMNDPESHPGFKPVTKLLQLIYLLKVALIKTKTVMDIQLKSQMTPSMESRANSISKEQSYIRTVNDIKTLRAKRNSLKITRDNSTARLNSMTRNNFIQSSNSASKLPADKSAIEEFNNSKALTLDDISRIVAVEQARELSKRRDFKQQTSSADELSKTLNSLSVSENNVPPSSPTTALFATHKPGLLKYNSTNDINKNTKVSNKGFRHFNKMNAVSSVSNTSGVYYSDLSIDHLYKLQLIALSILKSSNFPIAKMEDILVMLKKHSQPQLVNPSSSAKFWKSSKTIKRLKQSTEQNRLFGLPLDVLCEAAGVDSDLGRGSNRVRIPLLLDELISALKQMDMSVEGLFRKNGNIKKLRMFTEEVNETPVSVPDLSKENSVQLSALLKKFFRDLPESLLTGELYQNWLNLPTKSEERKMDFVLFYTLLPKYHRNVSEVLLSFLNWVSTFANIENPAQQSGSKMDIHNLATVFAPNVLYQEKPHRDGENDKDRFGDYTLDEELMKRRMENGVDGDYVLVIEVVKYLILHIDEICMVPMFLMKLLNRIINEKLSTYEQIQEFIANNYSKIDFSEF
ncbi:hypothetical protein ACO0RG_000935 [Hanseniaspora osmophila]